MHRGATPRPWPRNPASRGLLQTSYRPDHIAGERKDAAMAAHIAEMASRGPVGRIGTPDEVAATVSRPTSEKGAFINGQMIQVNGGAET